VIAVLIPSYGRADRLARVAENVHSATESDHELVFALEASDQASIDAATDLDCTVVVNELAPNYSGAITTAYRQTDAPFIFAGADDLDFRPGWDTAALAHMDGWVMVVGTNDLLNPYVTNGSHATHYLVDRTYLDEIGGVVDQGPGSFLFDGYSHQYTDTEFIGTAKMRARFRPCFDSIVEHLHAWSDKPGRAAPDTTTAKANAHLEADAALYDSRRDLWFSISR